jgi:GcrA cell cycle regulator
LEVYQWTDERIALLIKLRDEGVCAADIGERIGTSKNAVLGKAFRLNLPPPKIKPTSTPGPRKPREASKPRLVRATHNSLFMVPKATIQMERLRCVEIEPRHLALIDLEPGDCRYPYGDGTITFCGHPKMAGSSYCVPHKHLTSEPPRAPIYRFARAVA